MNFSTHFVLFLLKEIAWISGGLRFFALFHSCNIDNLEMAYMCKFLLVAHGKVTIRTSWKESLISLLHLLDFTFQLLLEKEK